jgi:tetratricopeptide (TPR) repeat protein
MKTQDLMQSHKYDEVIAESRQRLTANPEDKAAMGWMADALQAKGAYRETIEWLERLDSLRSEDKQFNTAVPGHPGSRARIACLHWLLGERARAILGMHGSASGILDRTIKYADAAGGMSQGLLLYYMAVTARIPAEASYALDYLRNRVENLRKLVREHLSRSWPCPVAQYLLGDVAFESVLEEVERQPKLAVPDAAARIEIGRRNRLMLALFYDGVRSRVAGDETHCLSRMREAYLLENQSLAWFLARHEIQQAGWADDITS